MGVEYKDYYRILGVDKRADDREIKAAFRRMARRYHPDVNPRTSTKLMKCSETLRSAGATIR